MTFFLRTSELDVHALHDAMWTICIANRFRGCLRRVSAGDQGLPPRCENGKKWLRKRTLRGPVKQLRAPRWNFSDTL